MKEKIQAEIAKCYARLEILNELLAEVRGGGGGGGASTKKLGRPKKIVQPAPTVKLKLDGTPRKRSGPKPKVKVAAGPKPKVAKVAKTAKAEKVAKKTPKTPAAPKGGKRARLVYPGVNVVLANITKEPQGISAISKAVGFDQKLVSVVLKQLMENDKIVREGERRGTTYKRA